MNGDEVERSNGGSKITKFWEIRKISGILSSEFSPKGLENSRGKVLFYFADEKGVQNNRQSWRFAATFVFLNFSACACTHADRNFNNLKPSESQQTSLHYHS